MLTLSKVIKWAASPLIALSMSHTAMAKDMPYEKQYKEILGSQMAYIDEGQGQPIVFLHGNPTSSYLWRNILPYMADDYRVIAPDLIGMGDSDKPNIAYTYADQANYLHTLLDSFELKEAIFVIHDWGSALGFHYARTRSDRIAAIAFMEATLPPFYPMASMESMGESAEFLKNVRSQGIGEEIVLNKNMMLDRFLKYGNPNKPLSDATVAEYNRYYDTAESRLPILQWLREIPIGGTPALVHDLGLLNNKWIESSEIPKLLFYVTPGVLVTKETVSYLEENVKNLDTIKLGPAGHFVQEAYPDEIGQGLADWLKNIK